MRKLSLAVAAAAVAGAAVLAGSAAAASSAGWSPTQTRGLTLQGTKLGALPGSTGLHVAVALKLRNASTIADAVRAGSTLTPDAFASTYAPSAADVQAVENYLSAQGLTNVQATPNRLFVTATATAAQAESAFDTQLVRYSVKGETLYANATAAQVPDALAGSVLSVLGLNDAARMHGRVQPSAGTPNYLTDYTPQQFWQSYDVGQTETGSGTSVAIFTEGDMSGVIADLRTEEQANSLPQVPVSVVHAGIASPDTAGADEWDMDTQFSTGMAGTVQQLYLYTATTLTDSDITLDFNRFAADDLAQAGSASFGECEFQAYLDGSMVAMDQVFAEAALQGQTVFASSGDTGGFCPVVPDNGVPAGAPDVNYPAASPYVVSAGGTTLLTNSDGSYDQETAWVAGGGGPSYFEYQPYWQNGVAPPLSSTCVEYVACPGKALPDVAMDADPESGAEVYVNGQPEGVGGTSLSSPLALGVWARLESRSGNTLGFAAPPLYKAYGTSAFHDITLGDTGPYPATPGWDFATGLGSFDVAGAAQTLVPNPAFTTGPGGGKGGKKPPKGGGSGGGTGSTGPTPAFPSPACTVLNDRTGDAQPLGSTGNVDSLDILAAGFETDGSNLTAKLRLESLNDGPGGTPQLAGDGDVWYVLWSYGGTTYFLGAELPGTGVDPSNPTALPVDYSYGTVDRSATGGNQYTTVGSATGSLDASGGVLTISAPLSVLGGPASGAALTATAAQTFESAGTPAGGLLEQADAAGPGVSYTVGSSC